MALARSASGPGGLSINTTSANSPFGSTSTTPAAGGMFGNTQASTPLFGNAAKTTAPQSGGLFGSAGTTTSQPAGGLFGTTTTSQPQTGGLFGSTATTSQPQAGGLFGSTTASAQPATGGLFGSAPATSQAQPGGLFGSAQQSGGGLFGNSNMPQPAPAGGLFGSSTATSQPQGAGGLFGALGSQPAQNQNQNTGGGLFGGNTTQQNQGGGLFGGGLNTQNKPAGSLFTLESNQNQQSQQQQPSMFSSTQNQAQQPLGGSFMSNQQQQQQTAVPGVRIDLANIKGSTRINDLHEDLQKQMEQIENVILGSQQHMRDCEAMMPKHEEDLTVVPADVDFCTRKLNGLTDLMEGDAQAVAGLKTLVEEDAAHAKLSFMGIDNLKLPPQYHTPGHWPTKTSGGDRQSQGNGSRDAQDIVGYLSSTADELTVKLANHQKNITEIESHLRGVEASTAQQIHTYILRKNGGVAVQSDQIQELAESLQDFERGILNVAGKVGSTREGVQSLQLGGFMRPTNGRATSARRSNVY